MAIEQTVPYSVDASVAVKWFVDEEASDVARALVVSGRVLVAPDVILAEVAAALTSKIRRREFAVDRLTHSLDELERTVSLLPTRPVLDAAKELSLASGTTFFDCVYLALAVRVEGILVTADRRFRNGMGPRFREVIEVIEDPSV